MVYSFHAQINTVNLYIYIHILFLYQPPDLILGDVWETRDQLLPKWDRSQFNSIMLRIQVSITWCHAFLLNLHPAISVTSEPHRTPCRLIEAAVASQVLPGLKLKQH